MNLNVSKELIRIIMHTGGVYLWGPSVANGDLYTGAIGGAIQIAAFIWWVATKRAEQK